MAVDILDLGLDDIIKRNKTNKSALKVSDKNSGANHANSKKGGNGRNGAGGVAQKVGYGGGRGKNGGGVAGRKAGGVGVGKGGGGRGDAVKRVGAGKQRQDPLRRTKQTGTRKNKPQVTSCDWIP